MRFRVAVAGAVAAAAALTASTSASAFCGFYVSGADAKLFADATQVVLMREGTKTVLSMQNDYKGPPDKFAMVIPVPVILTKENVKILPKEIFDKVDKLGAPRLVEYWEQDPCPSPKGNMWGDQIGDAFGAGGLGLSGVGEGGGGRDLGVKVEAKFAVGEYEIVVLSAKNAAGLDTWLRDEKYAIPAGAEPFLRPYVLSGMKFFVAKVDPAKVKFENGRAALSPIRFHYDAETFALPVRLGLINSSGTQDLIVNILAKRTRYEVANYPNVTIPTNLDVADSVRPRFGEFYASLFDGVLAKNPRAVVTEYAWDAGTCDPCPGPTLDGNDLATLGADVIPNGTQGLSPPSGSTLGNLGTSPAANPPKLRDGGVVISGGLPVEVTRRILRTSFGRFRNCYEAGLRTNPKLAGKVIVKFAIGQDGAVTRVGDPTGDLSDANVRACLARSILPLAFPQPSNAAQVDVTFTLDLAPPDPPTPAKVAPAPAPRAFFSSGSTPFVLTRLHVRYGKDVLGEDLVFKTAPAIAGGREVQVGGALEKTSHPEAVNNFQARYAMRHPWTGKIACKSPQRGVWGGPPSGTAASPAPMAAQQTAFAPRGNMPLASFVVGGAPELGLATPASGIPASLDAGTAPDPAPADAGSDGGPDGGVVSLAPEPKRGCGGCAVVGASDPHSAPALATVAFILAGSMVRGRRRRLEK